MSAASTRPGTQVVRSSYSMLPSMSRRTVRPRAAWVDRAAVQFAIAVRGGLEVEGDAVEQLFGHGFLNNRRRQAVGVELDLQAERLHIAQEGEQPRIDRRLAAGDDDAVDKGTALPQFVEERRYRDVRVLIRIEDQRGIVTIGANQVAAAEEDQRGDPPRKIEETRPLKTFDRHRLLALG